MCSSNTQLAHVECCMTEYHMEDLLYVAKACQNILVPAGKQSTLVNRPTISQKYTKTAKYHLC